MSSQASKRKKEQKTVKGSKKRKDYASKSESSATSSKRALKLERQSQRKHADAVQEAKRLWNQLRLKTNSPEKTRELMDQMMPLMKGKCHEIAMQHDASRVVQAALQFGNDEERLLILEELCVNEENSFVELAKKQYSHFVVLKSIKYCQKSKACIKLVTKALTGHMTKLAVHAVASRVVEALFLTLSAKQTASLKQEFYGPHFSLFAATDMQRQKSSPTLESNLAAQPSKKEVTLDFVKGLIRKGMEKSLYGFSYFQELFAEYIATANPKEIRQMAGGPASEHAIHLVSTRAGTRVVAALVAYGTAKDRKRIMKSLKGYSRSGLLHHNSYLAILRLVQLTDDTVSVNKNIFQELLTKPSEGKEPLDHPSPLLEIALSDTGCKLFLLVLMQDEHARKKCFDPYELNVLSPTNPVIEDEDGNEVPTSKKDADVRRKELIKYLRESLVDLCSQHTEELLRSRQGSLLLRQVYAAFHPGSLVKSVVEVCLDSVEKRPPNGHSDGDGYGASAAADDDNDDYDNRVQKKKDRQLPILEDRTGHLAVKGLLVEDASGDETVAGETYFARSFFSAIRAHLVKVATTSNRGAFVVVALCKVASVRSEVIALFQPEKTNIEKLASGEGPTAGFKALLNEIFPSS